MGIAAVVAAAWVLLLNAIVGFQIMEDGTPLSMALIIGSSLAFIVGVGYIALDTAFSWTGYWDDTLGQPNRAYALYTLYLLVPLIFVVAFRCRGFPRRRCAWRTATTALSFRCCTPLRDWPDLPIRCVRPHLQRCRRKDQRGDV